MAVLALNRIKLKTVRYVGSNERRKAVMSLFSFPSHLYENILNQTCHHSLFQIMMDCSNSLEKSYLLGFSVLNVKSPQSLNEDVPSEEGGWYLVFVRESEIV